MRWKVSIVGSIALALAVGFGVLVRRHHGMEARMEAQAVNFDHALVPWKYLCAAATIQSFLADELRISITLLPANPSVAAGLGCNATNQVIGGVHGEVATSILSCSMSGIDKFITVKSVPPIHKVSGLMCRSQDFWGLQIYGDPATDLATLDLFAEAITVSVPTAGRKTDNKSSSSPVFVYAFTGTCDGCGGAVPDKDGVRNGQIIFGGTGGVSMGNNEFVIFAKYRGDAGGPLVSEEWNAKWVSE